MLELKKLSNCKEAECSMGLGIVPLTRVLEISSERVPRISKRPMLPETIELETSRLTKVEKVS